MTFDPAKTHAVVVGVGQVEMGAAWRLPGAPQHAVEFVEWLRKSGVPAGNIHLFLSTKDQADYSARVQAAGVTKVLPATRSAFEDFIDKELKLLSGDLLYLYWSGHGNISEKANRILFFEDWEEGLHHRHFDLTNALERFRRDPYGAQFPEQYAYVDACANEFPFEHKPGENTVALQSLVPGVRQLFFLAADSGQQARAGEFSKHLLAALTAVEADTGSWPPDPDRVVDKVLPHFEDATQRPVGIEWRTKAGSAKGISYRAGDLPSSQFVNAVEIGTGMPLRHMRQLAGILSSYEVFDKREAREELYAGLAARAGKAKTRKPPQTRDEDLLEVVATAFYWDAEKWMVEEVEKAQSAAAELSIEFKRTALLRRVREVIRKMLVAGFAMHKVREAYRTTISSLSTEPARENARTLAEMLDELCIPVTLEEQYGSLYEFLLRLAAMCPPCAPELKALVDPARLQALEDALAREQRFTLRISIYEDEGKPQSISAQLFESATESPKERWPDFVADAASDGWTQAEAAVRSVIQDARKLLQQRYQKTTPSALEIEFILPLPFLLKPCDEIAIPMFAKKKPVGQVHPVVVRWLDRRLYPMDTNHHLWSQQRAAYAPYRGKCAKVSWIDSGGLENPQGACGISALRFCPGDSEALVELLLAGKPFLTWLRNEPAGGWQKFEGELAGWVSKQRLNEVPARLVSARSATPPAPFASALTLFWDDPEHDFVWKCAEVGTPSGS